MKKHVFSLTGIFLAVALLIGCCIPAAYASSYHDVTDSDWRTEAIEYVTAIGLMQGVGNGSFQPNQPLTRAQVVTLLYRLAGSPEAEYAGQFQDVSEDAWYAIPVSWAYQQDIVHGMSETIFSPSTNITREQLAVIINNYVTTKEIELQTVESALYRVKDCWSVSLYAEEGVMMVCETGLMNPDSQHNFNPRNTVTRADAAVVFMRLNKALAGESLSIMLVPNTAMDVSKLSQAEKDAQALAIAQQIASVIPKDISDIERVVTAAQIVALYSKFCTYTMSGKDYCTAYGVFIKGEYSCAGSTRALGLVLTCMGYQWRHVNENQYTHQWCELNIGGRTVVADGQGGGVAYKTGESTEPVRIPFGSPWPHTFRSGE